MLPVATDWNCGKSDFFSIELPVIGGATFFKYICTSTHGESEKPLTE